MPWAELPVIVLFEIVAVDGFQGANVMAPPLLVLDLLPVMSTRFIVSGPWATTALPAEVAVLATNASSTSVRRSSAHSVTASR
jgi:hypothetical protein